MDICVPPEPGVTGCVGTYVSFFKATLLVSYWACQPVEEVEGFVGSRIVKFCPSWAVMGVPLLGVTFAPTLFVELV